ncbi:MAG: amidohydrolase family protein [Candidatus Asgardarchaeia archaeon]
MELLLKGKYILTMSERYGVIKDGAVVINNNKIADVGKYEDMKKKYHDSEEFDASDKIIMPGLISSHNHMYGILSHGMPIPNAPSTFIGFLEEFWWPYVENLLDKDTIYQAAKVAAIEMIKTGTTLHADILEAPFAIPGALDIEKKATEEVGIRSILSFEATERVSPENGELGIKENLEFVKKHLDNKESLTRGMFCIHTTFTCSPEFLKKVRELANQYKAGIHLHLEEGDYETIHALVKYRKLPVELYEEIGFLGPDVLTSQVVQTKLEEIKILKKYDVKISHMPISNCEVGGGIAPVPQMLEEGLTVGLGTDGYIVDMFHVMRFAFLIHKANLKNAAVMPADVVIKMATTDNAKVLRMNDLVGSIEPGKLADIITVSPMFPTPVNEENLINQLVVFGEGRFVNDVFVNGKLIMKNREILTVDEEEEKKKLKEVANQFWDMIKKKAG